jgi:uncharacterized protein (DUF3820 family)
MVILHKMYFSEKAVVQVCGEEGLTLSLEMLEKMTTLTKQDDDAVMPFGKYKGMPIHTVAANDPSYLGWVLEYLKKPGQYDNATLIARIKKALEF